jgi:hypothetical protein
VNYLDVFKEPSRPVQVEGDVPLRSKVDDSCFGKGALDVPVEERNLLMNCVAWRTTPPFEESGRSALAIRKEPLTLGSDVIRGYKLKGVGVYDERSGLASPPQDQVYQRTAVRDLDPRDTDIRDKLLALIPQILVHTGINASGEFYPVMDPPKPKGGLSDGRGQREFENAVLLHRAGISACRPVAWGAYPDLPWEGAPMQWVVLGLPNVEQRSSACFDVAITPRGDQFDYNDYLKNVAARQSDAYLPGNHKKPVLNVLRSLGNAMGKALRAAHDRAGVARFAGHPGNFTYVPEDRSVMMHDFDSSVTLDSIAPKARAFTRIRDIESVQFGLLTSLAHSRLFYVIKDEELFRKANPLGQVLAGYFDEVDTGAEGKILADLSVSELLKFGHNPYPHQQTEWVGDLSEKGTCGLTALGARAYRKSGLNEVDPIPMNEQNLVRSFMTCSNEGRVLAARKMQEVAATLPSWAKTMLGY